MISLASLRRALPLVVILLVITQMTTIAPFPTLAHASNLTFASVINLSNDPTASGLPRIVAVGNNVYVLWLNNTLGNSDILFRASNNNGSSFGPVINLSSSPTGDSITPQVASVGSDVYVVWQQNVSLSSNSIFFRASTNNGTSFGSMINISSGVSGLSTSTAPEIAATGNNVYVTWLATTTKGTNEILFKASTTNGSNLATVTALILSTKAYGSAQPRIAAQASDVYVTWSDNSPGRAQTFFTVSSNSGTSFGTPFSLSSTLAGETDLYQEIAASGSSVYVTWTNDTLSTDNTMFAASTNNGVSFSHALNLNKAIVTDLYPELAASGNNVYIVWSDASGGNTEVFYRVSSNNGASFGSIWNMSSVPGTSNQQTIAASASNVYVTWVHSGTSNDDVFFVSSSDNGSTFGTVLNLSNNPGFSDDPVVAASGRYAYVAWQDDTTGNGDIYFSPGTVVTSVPTVLHEGVTTATNQSIIINLDGNDASGLPLTFSIVTSSSHGSLGPVTSSGSNTAQVTFTPNPNFVGPDSFTFTASNGSANSAPASVVISVYSKGATAGGGGGGAKAIAT